MPSARLLIISHTPHYVRDGVTVGWAPTVREIDRLASRFATVRHVACLHDEPAPTNAVPYAARNVELVPVAPSGGPGLLGKLDAMRALGRYALAIRRELAMADIVHVRAPASIALVALLQLERHRDLPRWLKYAGDWRPVGRDHASYAMQRWLLRRQRGRVIVTVNGEWPGDPEYVRAFHNPSLEAEELVRGREAAERKRSAPPLRLAFVGALHDFKGADRAIKVLAAVRAEGVDATLEVVGDGPERARCEEIAARTGVRDAVTFAGWLPPTGVHAAYARAHLLLLPSETEGWPKVVSEGMAFGVVPIVGDVSRIRQQLARLETGHALPPRDVSAWTRCVLAYARAPERWTAESKRAVDGANQFSFAHYLNAVDGVLAELGVSA